MNYREVYQVLNDSVQTTEHKAIVNLVEEAFQKAANTFHAFIRKKVHVELITLHSILQEMQHSKPNKLEKFVLVSELKGDIKGKCYLCFETLDAKKLFEISQETVLQAEDAMLVDFLLELDNILTASMVALLSDKLKMHVYAFVPQLYVWNESQMAKALLHDHSIEKLIFNFNTKFVLENSSITSNFIWVMEMRFLETILHKLETGKIA